ncbi:uncharacterized protein KIAA0930 homolog isoform X4 [Punica granatum]|uniref:Uncharacterized protein KIAA0930 homolog isoform X4 n=1 Tax=Punica granatum TaxID=22663 RepID=A0A6P8C3T7_PUNGR|nr:uncharacterized protein KIAA0930 homolog isoform X4 [Punica granatum]
MIGDGGETPSRRELLSMVKKHSNLIGKTVVEEQDASDVEMDSQFWHDVFDLYFVRGKESRGRQDDDLIFLVRKMSSQAYRDNPEGTSPFFVRRWASKMEKLVGDISADVDWRRSFYLNLIAHTSYTITVAICSHQDLRNHQAGQDTQLSPIYKVLSSTDHCYCVLLNAHDGAAFPSVKELSDGSSSNAPPGKVETNPGSSNSKKITLFSGFVSYQMVLEAYNAGKSQFGSLLSLGHSPGKTDRLFMKGPGGRGEVEVAVSGVVDQSHEDAGPFSPVSVSRRGFGIGSIFQKAATVASVAAKHAYAAASAATNHEEEMIPLKCCLMSVSLPWEHIAYDLLFKGNPPVNI